jgi:hypothetical protein
MLGQPAAAAYASTALKTTKARMVSNLGWGDVVWWVRSFLHKGADAASIPLSFILVFCPFYFENEGIVS